MFTAMLYGARVDRPRAPVAPSLSNTDPYMFSPEPKKGHLIGMIFHTRAYAARTGRRDFRKSYGGQEGHLHFAGSHFRNVLCRFYFYQLQRPSLFTGICSITQYGTDTILFTLNHTIRPTERVTRAIRFPAGWLESDL